MKPFSELTRRGKGRRLRQLAITALEHYDLDVRRVELAGLYTNAIFRVRTGKGPGYALRLCAPGWRTETDLRSEIAWLQAIHRDTDLGAPVPLPARDGETLLTLGREDIPGPNRCVVMSWLPGVPLEKRLNEENLYKMGILFARLHEHGARFQPPPGFTARRMDRVCAREEKEVLFEDGFRGAFTPHNREVFERVRKRVEDTYARLYADPAGLRVIHHDLWHGNIKVHRGRLHPFDFEDTTWGYPLQDIAMALQDLMQDTTPQEFEPLQAAFRRGYESLATWPETAVGQIDTFRAGRMLWVANFVAGYEKEHLAEHITKITPMLAAYLNTGLLRKVSP